MAANKYVIVGSLASYGSCSAIPIHCFFKPQHVLFFNFCADRNFFFVYGCSFFFDFAQGLQSQCMRVACACGCMYIRIYMYMRIQKEPAESHRHLNMFHGCMYECTIYLCMCKHMHAHTYRAGGSSAISMPRSSDARRSL